MPPSGYGVSGHRNTGTGTEGYFSGHNAYTLSSVGRDGLSDKNASAGSSAAKEYGIGVKREVQITTTGRNESEEELHSPQPWVKANSHWQQ